MNNFAKNQAKSFLQDLDKIKSLLPEQKTLDAFLDYDSVDAGDNIEECMKDVLNTIVKDKNLFAKTPEFRKEVLEFAGEEFYINNLINKFRDRAFRILRNGNKLIEYKN